MAKIANYDDEIIKEYKDEYFDRQTKEQKGFWGNINRFFDKFSGSGSDKELTRMLLPAFGVVFLSQLVGLALPIAIVTPVALPAMFGVISLSIVSYVVTKHKAKKLIKEDIKNGSLLKRYNKEFLQTKVKSLTLKGKSLIAQANSIKDEFNSDKKSKKKQQVSTKIKPKPRK